MQDALKGKIEQYMGQCRACTIATAGADGQPAASTVFFKNAGLNIFFNTWSDSQKVGNLARDPRVAITMQQDGPIPKGDKGIKGIQYIGKARVVQDEGAAGVPQAVLARHRAFNSAKSGQSVIIAVSPQRIYMVDYSQGFRHRDTLEL
jgi:uncharacterized protein YhbP (UPF0306 family)